MKNRIKFVVAMTLSLAFACAGQAEIAISVTFLEKVVEQPPVLSNLDPLPETLGRDGAALALAENRSSGMFLGHDFSLEVVTVELGGDLLAAARSALAKSPYMILHASSGDLLKVADLPEAANAILFNTSAPDIVLRDTECRANLLHTLPSLAMRSDALMQVLQKKRFSRLALLAGPNPSDQAFAEALRRSAAKFGLTIVAETDWAFDADMRRNAAQEVPLLTQDLGKHDVLLVSDEIGDFGRYIPYNTWLPRPVAGSEGLVPVAWGRVVEQWGAVQLQNRFHELAGRPMRPVDYAAWAAMRSLGEAVARTGSAEPATLRAYLLSNDFELGGFKGRPLSFRSWNGQLRQPIPLVTERAVVMQAPVEGFLHQRTELDTLGLDAPESNCTAFKE